MKIGDQVEVTFPEIPQTTDRDGVPERTVKGEVTRFERQNPNNPVPVVVEVDVPDERKYMVAPDQCAIISGEGDTASDE